VVGLELKKKEIMTIAEAKQVLRDNGYFVDNLWHIHDVYNVADGNIQKDQAMQVLSMALTNEATMEQIWQAIKMATEILTE
jgi:hypothetical protein